MRAIYARDIILNNVNLKASSSPNVHFKITIFPRDIYLIFCWLNRLSECLFQRMYRCTVDEHRSVKRRASSPRVGRCREVAPRSCCNGRCRRDSIQARRPETTCRNTTKIMDPRNAMQRLRKRTRTCTRRHANRTTVTAAAL